VQLILRDGIMPVGLGIALGIGATLAASRWLSSLLFAVSSRDPLMIGAAAMFLVAVAIVASIVPVRRALAVDPATAVRVD
jgi:ABC-type antimicrobial peptide transport system permease subunit